MKLHILDSHTGGEPTRLIVPGHSGRQSIQEVVDSLNSLQSPFLSLVKPPRSPSYAFGALLVASEDDFSKFEIVFFDCGGAIAMCVHGIIGVVSSLRRFGLTQQRAFSIDTIAGTATVDVSDDEVVVVNSVPAFVRRDIRVPVRGKEADAVLAYGGNWFLIVDLSEIDTEMGDAQEIVEASQILESVALSNAAPEAGNQLFVMLVQIRDNYNSKGFVLCPSGQYDRSPCGTGFTSLLAHLYNTHRVEQGQVWRHFGPSGDSFSGVIQSTGSDGTVSASISGRATVFRECTEYL